jgi:hypothetical protein
MSDLNVIECFSGNTKGKMYLFNYHTQLTSFKGKYTDLPIVFFLVKRSTGFDQNFFFVSELMQRNNE